MKPAQMKALIQRGIADGITREAENIRKQTVQQVFAVMLVILHDKHQFTPFAIKQIMEQWTEAFEAVGDKYVKIEDFAKLLCEMGIEVTE